jgi:hypothetical protein
MRASVTPGRAGDTVRIGGVSRNIGPPRAYEAQEAASLRGTIRATRLTGKGLAMNRHVLNRLVLVALLVSLAASGAKAAVTPPPVDLEAADAEVKKSYAGAHPEVQEYVLHTARSFGQSGFWLNEGAFDNLAKDEREVRIAYLQKLFADAEYGRHLCPALAEASAYKDARLVPGLMKVAGYHKDDQDYDCRPKWMAIAALARQQSPDAVPLLVSLVDHGNQNCRMWARAALARMAGDDFKTDKQAWNKWWVGKGHAAIDEKLLKPYTPPPSADAKPAAEVKPAQ